MNGNRFYSITTVTNENSELLLTRVGANDPDFNLRTETGFMIRQSNTDNQIFVSVIEPHGIYDLTKEVTENFKSSVASVELIQNNDDFTVVLIKTKTGKSFILATLNKDFNSGATKKFNYNNKTYSFTGNYYYSEL